MSATNLLKLKEWPAIGEAPMRMLAEKIACKLKTGDVIALGGDLGSGKTTLARAMIQSLRPDPVDVTSPTFTLMQEYPVQLYDSAKATILHCDLYRLKSENEVYSIGLLDMLDDHITLIEWPEIIERHLPMDTLYMKCSIGGDKNTRRLCLFGVGEWNKRLPFLQQSDGI